MPGVVYHIFIHTSYLMSKALHLIVGKLNITSYMLARFSSSPTHWCISFPIQLGRNPIVKWMTSAGCTRKLAFQCTNRSGRLRGDSWFGWQTIDDGKPDNDNHLLQLWADHNVLTQTPSSVVTVIISDFHPMPVRHEIESVSLQSTTECVSTEAGHIHNVGLVHVICTLLRLLQYHHTCRMPEIRAFLDITTHLHWLDSTTLWNCPSATNISETITRILQFPWRRHHRWNNSIQSVITTDANQACD